MAEFDPTLNELVRIQQSFDIENFSGADTLDGKRTHVVLHLGKLMGKYAGIEEQADHGVVDESLLASEIAPDLLVYAAQLTEYTGGDLYDRYLNHVWGGWKGSDFLDNERSINLIARLQWQRDDKLYTDNKLASHNEQRRSIYFGLHRPVADLAAIEGKKRLLLGDIGSIRRHIAPQLVRSAIQVANLCDVNLSTAYKERLESVAERNGTGIESVNRAIRANACK